MLQLTPDQRFFLSVEPVDFRRGIDALRAYCQRQWQTCPFSGQVFMFRNRNRTAVKILSYDGNGFWLCQKRFSSGKLAWWPRTINEAASVRAVDLIIMLQQGNPAEANVPEEWRRLPLNQPLCLDNSKATNAVDEPLS